MPEVQRKIIEKIKSARTIAILMHNSPDGDCIGSAIALEHACKTLGKKIDLVIQDKISHRFSPIIGEKRVGKIFLPPQGKLYDLVILLDCTDPKRTIPNIRKMTKSIIVIDHHKVDRPYGDLYLYRPYAATGIIIYDLIKDLTGITPEIANALYFSIASDTGGFKNSNTDARTLEVCSDLIRHGTDIDLITKIFESKSLSLIMLLGNVLKNINFDINHKLTTLLITRDQIKESGANDSDAASVVDYIKDVEGADVTLLFIEGINNVRIRARSKETSVRSILNHFGGGGHDKASGCAIEMINKGVDGIVEDVINYTKEYIEDTKL